MQVQLMQSFRLKPKDDQQKDSSGEGRVRPKPIKHVKLIIFVWWKKFERIITRHPFNMRNSMTIVSHTPKTTHRSTNQYSSSVLRLLWLAGWLTGWMLRSSDSLLRSCSPLALPFASHQPVPIEQLPGTSLHSLKSLGTYIATAEILISMTIHKHTK